MSSQQQQPLSATTTNAATTHSTTTSTSTKQREIPLISQTIEIGEVDEDITPLSTMIVDHNIFDNNSSSEMTTTSTVVADDSDEAATKTPSPPSIFNFTNVPEYEINLDLPSSERWKSVIGDFKDKFPALIAFLEEEMDGVLGGGLKATFAKTFLNMLFNVFTNSGAVYYSQELKAVAELANLPLGLFAFMQMSYELFACCTSIVKEGSDGFPIHVRTMDWAMDFLKSYTIQLNFTKNGTTLFKASSWAGYLGVLTGCRPGAFSVSINFRCTEDGHFGKNVLKSITRGWPVSFLVRETLARYSTFSDAVQILKNSKLIAPVYITVAGCNEGEGVIITRNRESFSSDPHLIYLKDLKQEENEMTKLYYLKESNALIQTNADWWRSLEDIKQNWNILYSSQRLKKANSLLKRMPKEETTIEKLTGIFTPKNHPLLNETTIYICAMNPSNGDYATILV